MDEKDVVKIKCKSPICALTIEIPGYCSIKCERKEAARRHNHRINVILSGKERKRHLQARDHWRKEIIQTRIEKGVITRKLANLGVKFELEWTLGISPHGRRDADAFRTEILLNEGMYTNSEIVALAKEESLGPNPYEEGFPGQREQVRRSFWNIGLNDGIGRGDG